MAGIQVPQYERQVAPQLTPTPYNDVKLNEDMFGINVSKAMGNIGKNLGEVGNALIEIKNKYDDTKILEMVNNSSAWEQEHLWDKDKGYFYKFGKDAYGRSEELLKDYDDFMTKHMQNAKLSPWAVQRAKETYLRTRDRVQRQITAHDFEQGINWTNSEVQKSIDNFITNAYHGRNDEKEIANALISGYQAIEWQGETQHMDRSAIDLKKMQYRASLHEKVLDGYIADGSLKANDYFEKYKNEISPQKLLHYENAVKNNEIKYVSSNIANELFAKYDGNEQKAIEELNNKNLDSDVYDSTNQKLSALFSQKRTLKEQEQNEAKNLFYDSAAKKIQNGEKITIDDIPQNLNGKNYIEARKAIDSLNSIGDITTDDETKVYLEYMSNYDAQRFKGIDLTQYKLSLSSDDYKALEKRQMAIRNGDFYTVINNIDSTKKYIQQVTGITEDTTELFNQYQNMVRAFEEKEGRKITDIEKENFLKYLGTDENQYKKIKKQIENGNEFYNAFVNNIAYYQAHHNGEMPPNDMVDKWIKQQAVQYHNKKYNEFFEHAVKNTTPKQNEQITLTQFADEFVPSIGNRIRADLKVTDRYRPSNGKYTSKHSEGRACDVSYKTKNNEMLSLSQKTVLWQSILDNPTVEKIAVSSADKDGAYLIKKFGKKYKDKIQDMNAPDPNGKSRDTNLSTNHTNHIHVTLYKDNTFKGTDKIAVKNRLKQNGFSDEQIQLYLSNKGY